MTSLSARNSIEACRSASPSPATAASTAARRAPFWTPYRRREAQGAAALRGRRRHNPAVALHAGGGVHERLPALRHLAAGGALLSTATRWRQEDCARP